MGGDRSGQLARSIKPMGLNSSHTTLRAPRMALEHRSQNLITDEGEHADGFEELSSQCFGRSVVEPDPGPGLKPIRIHVGQEISARSNLFSTATLSRDQRTVGRSMSRSRSA